MKKRFLLALMMVLAMGMTACSSKPKEDGAATEAATEPENESESGKASGQEAAAGTDNADEGNAGKEIAEDGNEEEAPEEEIPEGVTADPITGIVQKYEDDVIVIFDEGDGLTYYFSTKNAQVTEGDSPIAVGDVVQVTYRGLLGGEDNPGEAVKIVAGVVR